VKTKGVTFDDVVEVGLTLPGAEEATAWGGRCLKVNGRHFIGMAINKSAEPNSLIIHVDTAQRDLMIEEQPDLYYTAPHYENYPCVLVRLSRLQRDVLEDLLRMAHRFVSARPPKRARSKRASRRPSRATKVR
jgi:hypothetical protein